MLVRLLLAASLVPLVLSAPPGLQAAEGRFVAVMRDGSTVALSGPPERKGEKFVGKLLPGGQLVSFPADDLDTSRTEEANRPPKPTATPRPEPILGHSSFPARASGHGKGAGGTASRRGTLTLLDDGWPSRSSPPAAEASSGEPADRHGHKEAWWRRKADPILARIGRLEAEVNRATARREEMERSVASGTKAGSLRVQKLQKEEATARRKLEAERGNLDRLGEEARKAGAYPGWIR